MSTGSTFVSPTRVTARSCSARRSFTCNAGDISPISSSKSVPPLAAWNFPGRAAIAPVKAPLACPNSSLSSRFSGMAPQLMAMNAPFLRGDRRCSSRAMSSFPVPDSPVTSTSMFVAATLSILRKISRIASQAPMMSP